MAVLPLQPVIIDEDGVQRFKANRIVSYLLDQGGIDMNKLAYLGANGMFSREEKEQFASLIGYSLCGFSELSYVSDAAYERAARSAPPLPKKRKAVRKR